MDIYILWGSHVIVPYQHRKAVLKGMHGAHPGMTQVKGLGWMFLWWPGVGGHRKNSPLVRIDGDTVQVQRTEYGRCQTAEGVHGVRLAVREHAH